MIEGQRGAAMVEFAVVLPLLLAVGFGITEFGRAIYTYNTLAKSARDGARYLSTRSAGDKDAWTTARNLVAYGNPKGSGAPLVAGLDAKNAHKLVAICDASNCPANAGLGTNPMINAVTVTVSGYQFTPLVDVLGLARFHGDATESIGAFTFGDISATMRQQ